MLTYVSLVGLLICAFPLGYLLLLAIASIRAPSPPPVSESQPRNRFIIAIAAHNEDSVIANTVERLNKLDYPSNLFSVHIVADHCSDNTVAAARQAGAIVHERNEGPRNGKGGALTWLFKQIFDSYACDAVVIFDADTRVDPKFLRVMDSRLIQGKQVIQGQHVIYNPDDGWFPALTWAMFLIDNRYQNLGRTNLGWSAKHMGDSICFKADVLRQIGWGEGLTEDYQLRQRLLLAGIKIFYEPQALGYGEAPLTWTQAQAQRARWLRGTYTASQQFARQLLGEGIRQKELALLDGALQAYFPCYSTLTIAVIFLFFLQLFVNWLIGPIFPWMLVLIWAIMGELLFVYPLFGLMLEKAPLKAFEVIMSGPAFMVWRTWLAITARFGKRQVVWIRTAHGGKS